jgi:hypothetical protein
MLKLLLISAISVVFLSSCAMPTNPNKIQPAYVSEDKYTKLSCSKLAEQLEEVSQRETRLVAAQKQRISTSSMQAFWWGFGQGDGLEAIDLAQVRGEREAISKAMTKCNK